MLTRFPSPGKACIKSKRMLTITPSICLPMCMSYMQSRRSSCFFKTNKIIFVKFYMVYVYAIKIVYISSGSVINYLPCINHLRGMST